MEVAGEKVLVEVMIQESPEEELQLVKVVGEKVLVVVMILESPEEEEKTELGCLGYPVDCHEWAL